MAQEFENDFLGKGWSFPPTFDNVSGEVMMTYSTEDIERSLEILLSTKVGERLMEPKYGCDMDDLVFEAIDTGLKTFIIDSIKTAILYFEPRIDAQKIELNMTNELEGVILVEIDYVVRATNSRFNFVYPYYTGEATELNFITTNNEVAL
jgi:phage baseplate assembly protein W